MTNTYERTFNGVTSRYTALTDLPQGWATAYRVEVFGNMTRKADGSRAYPDGHTHYKVAWWNFSAQRGSYAGRESGYRSEAEAIAKAEAENAKGVAWQAAAVARNAPKVGA
jgi:hypothetical protein